MKEMGNTAFKAQKYQEAEEFYSNAIKVCAEPKASAVLLANRAATRLKLRKYQGKAVQVEPSMCKHGIRRPAPWVFDSTPCVCHYANLPRATLLIVPGSSSKVKCDEPLPCFDFKFNLRRYTKEPRRMRAPPSPRIRITPRGSTAAPPRYPRRANSRRRLTITRPWCAPTRVGTGYLRCSAHGLTCNQSDRPDRT